MTILIDSGSSKMSWAALDEQRQLVREWQTIGINPYQQTAQSIAQQIRNNFPSDVKEAAAIYCYGAGASQEKQQQLQQTFQSIFTKAQTIDIQSDIVAIAHALCDGEEGIVGILGTGSNSAVFDGERIVDNIGGFGFIVGDEGSGGVLGRELMNQYLHRKLPEHLSQALEKRYQITPAIVIERVYRGDYPNRFLAGFAPFLHEFQKEKSIKTLINSQFFAYFEQKILCYDEADVLPIYLSGSIAYHFRPMIQEVADEYDLDIQKVVQSPMPNLIRYHQNKS
ncbi:MAG: BadF/BadG/BcrA/BcrD ATPase family protein [Bacteroidota bacterium]